MKKLKLIVTHPGQAHRDEVMACAMLLASQAVPIQRRDPTEDDLQDPEVAVVDCGRRHEPALANLDHHQMARGTVTCAFDLAMEWLGYKPEEYRDVFLWAEFTSRLDATGPGAAAAWLGCTPDALARTVSPIETSILRWFQDQREILPGSTLHALLVLIGTEKIVYLEKVSRRLRDLGEITDFERVGGIRVADVTQIPGDQEPTLGLEMFLRGSGDCPVTVTADDRGPGLCLFRRNDDPRIDFSRLEGREEILFAHKGGFVAKTKSPETDWRPLVEAAVVRPA